MTDQMPPPPSHVNLYDRWRLSADDFRRITASSINYVSTIVYALLLLVLIAFAGAATVEITERVAFQASLKGDIADPARSGSKIGYSISGNLTTQSPSSGKSDDDDDVKEEKYSRLPATQIERKKRELLKAVQLLSAVGADGPCWTLAAIVAEDRGHRCKLPQPGEAGVRSYLPPPPGSWSDESLFLALAICCGGIGALLAGLRTTKYTVFRDLGIGMTAGFIVYLGIKGGRYIFFMTTTDQPILLNPYAYAFAGILVGLFSERAYNLIISLIDELELRLRGSIRYIEQRSPDLASGSTSTAATSGIGVSGRNDEGVMLGATGMAKATQARASTRMVAAAGLTTGTGTTGATGSG